MRHVRRRLSYLLVVLLATAAALSAMATGAGSGDPLVTYEVTLTPNWVHEWDDPSSNYQAVWVYPTSPTTPWRSPDSNRMVRRYFLLDPRLKDADGRPGSDEFWAIIQRYWPSSYQPNNHGAWGTEVDWHNVAGDDGGIGWSWGDLVSTLALDWWPGDPAPSIRTWAHSKKTHLLPVPSRDTWHTYVMHYVAGRTDGTTVRPGSLRVWADGANTPVIDLHNINTLQSAKDPSGVTRVQRWMQLWEGDYTSGIQVKSTVRFALTRIGRTIDEAVNDRPTALGGTWTGQSYRGTGINLGPPSATQIEPLTAGSARIPAHLLRKEMGRRSAVGKPGTPKRQTSETATSR